MEEAGSMSAHVIAMETTMQVLEADVTNMLPGESPMRLHRKTNYRKVGKRVH